jgi:branched-chain amino acid transport system ATP-binding protein
MSMLEVNKISVFYGDAQALWDLSFTVNEGEVVTIVGSNGAGKTTTLRAVAGILHPRHGEITFLGKRIDTLPAHKIVEEGIAHIMEGRKLFPYMSVRENLELGAYTPRAWKRRVKTLEWIYELFPILKEREKQLAGTLSGGEQQMLAIGRGLMSMPKLLMLDEPSLGLAPKLVLLVFDIIRKINKEGVTVLLVEQNVHHALTLASRGYVLETGRITLEGKGKELLENPLVKKAYLGM